MPALTTAGTVIDDDTFWNYLNFTGAGTYDGVDVTATGGPMYPFYGGSHANTSGTYTFTFSEAVDVSIEFSFLDGRSFDEYWDFNVQLPDITDIAAGHNFSGGLLFGPATWETTSTLEWLGVTSLQFNYLSSFANSRFTNITLNGGSQASGVPTSSSTALLAMIAISGMAVVRRRRGTITP